MHSDGDGVGGVPVNELPTRLHAFTPNDNVSTTHDIQLKLLFDKLSSIHAKNEKGDGTGFCTHPDSIITLTVLPENYDKLFRKQYPIAHAFNAALNDIIQRWFKTGKIVYAPVHCKFNSPLLPVPKKDEHGKMSKARCCLDVRVLNTFLIENDKFQLPFIPDVLAAFAGGKLFGEYDLSEAYFQFHVAEESQPYTAFTWAGKQYMFTGCPFGIKHIPSLFQRFMGNLFRDMPFVFPYIDNIGFASESWEQHYEHAYAIMERLNSVNLRVSPTSYNLGNTHMRVLGHVISEHGVALDPEKSDMIKAWPLPLDGSSMASALGLGAFLRDHIRHYADITAPLEALKKEKVIVWNDKLTQHWDLFKRAFSTAPILTFPDFNKRFVIAHDASQTGIGGVLYQPNDDNNTITAHNIIAICSKQLNGTQRNYPVYKKELFGMIYCLRKFHTFIYGRRDILALTDHKPLVHILSQRTMTVALQQWVDVLLDYDLTVQYRPGILHIIPDALSRMYAATYQDPNIVWGTIDNIRILDNFNQLSSPSDFLCTQSLNDIKPLSTVRKRHRVNDVHHIYNVQQENQGRTDNDNSDSLKAAKSDLKATKSSEAYKRLKAPNNRLEADIAYMKQIYTYDDTCESMLDQDHEEYTCAEIAGPLYAASDPYTAHMAYMYIHANNRKIIHESRVHTKSAMTSSTPATPANDLTSSSMSNNNKPSHKLTDEEKLLLAYAKRGKMRPTEAIRIQLLNQAHTGHFGEKHMSYYIQREGYWWPRMRQDISAIIDACNDCRRYNAEVHGFHPSRSVTASLPGDHYQIDLAQFTPSTEGYVYCLLCVDVFTGFIMLKPLKNKSASTIANELWQIFSVIGVPKILQSDNGTEFKNEILNALTNLLGIPHRFISEYNPRADGKVERAVRTVKMTVMKLLHGATIYWPYHLPFVQYSYNDKISSLTGSTPFALMYGRTPNSCKDYEVDAPTDMPMNIQAWEQHRDDILSLIYPAISKRASKHQDKYRMKLDGKRRRLIHDQIKVGTQVMLKDPKYINNHSKAAHEPTYIGPYTIIKANRHGTYTVKDGLNNTINRNIPIDQMKIIHANIDTKLIPSNVEDKHNNGDEYEVESIIKHRVNNKGELEYYVKWKHYPLAAATWENENQFIDTAIIDRYFREKSIQSLSKRSTRTRVLTAGTYSISSMHTI